MQCSSRRTQLSGLSGRATVQDSLHLYSSIILKYSCVEFSSSYPAALQTTAMRVPIRMRINQNSIKLTASPFLDQIVLLGSTGRSIRMLIGFAFSETTMDIQSTTHWNFQICSLPLWAALFMCSFFHLLVCRTTTTLRSWLLTDAEEDQDLRW